MSREKMTSERVGVGEAKSKIILTGEHAVVYGIPAIAIPFPLHVRVRVRHQKEQGIHLQSELYQGDIEAVPPWLWGIRDMMRSVIEQIDLSSHNLHIQMDSKIPIGRGLGSSAAIAIALVRGLYAYAGMELEDAVLYQFVDMAESFAHGNASGIDMVTQSSYHPLLFQKNVPPKTLALTQHLYFCVADTGKRGATKEAVSRVADNYQQNPMKISRILDGIAQCVKGAEEAIKAGDMIGLGSHINNNHKLLMKLQVSDSSLNGLVDAAMEANALGAKMTGGGLGGCMIALCTDRAHCLSVGELLLNKGATKAWYFVTNQEEAVDIKPEGMGVQWA